MGPAPGAASSGLDARAGFGRAGRCGPDAVRGKVNDALDLDEVAAVLAARSGLDALSASTGPDDLLGRLEAAGLVQQLTGGGQFARSAAMIHSARGTWLGHCGQPLIVAIRRQ